MKKFFGLALLASLLFSCASNDDNTNDIVYGADYSKSILVTNEGNFMSANASISAISENLLSIENGIYKTTNNQSLGDVAQSMAFYEDLAFVVVNNSNTIEVVSLADFKQVATISQNLSSPRYAAIANNLLYVTNWNNTVTVYNAKTFDFIKTINLDFMPELIVSVGSNIYVSSNFYNDKSALAIINALDNTITTTLIFDLPINGLTQNKQKVYVLTTSDQKTVVETVMGKNKADKNEYAIPNARFLTIDSNTLYFTANLSIYALKVSDIQNQVVPSQLFQVEDNSWSSLYGFGVFDGKIYTSDAKGFTQASQITIYSTLGSKLATFSAGIGTNGFYKAN